MIKKTKIELLAIGILAIAFFTLSACGGGGGGDDEPGPTDQELQEELLLKNWSLEGGGSILLDGSDVSSAYDGFSMNIQAGTFSTTNAGDLFPASGTWEWVGDSDTQILTGRGKDVTIVSLDASTLVFTFLKTDGNTRFGVNGNYRITLK